jgi:hypothetical protein
MGDRQASSNGSAGNVRRLEDGEYHREGDTSPPVRREQILFTALDLVNGDRDVQYGDPNETHRCIAEMWRALLYRDDADIPINASTVAAMMVCVKLVRAVRNPTYMDSWVDIAAYAALGAEMAE